MKSSPIVPAKKIRKKFLKIFSKNIFEKISEKNVEKIFEKISEKNVSKNVLVFEKNVFSAKNIPGVVTIKRYSLPGPPTMLDDRPLIVPRFQGRSRDDHVVAHFLFENRSF